MCTHSKTNRRIVKEYDEDEDTFYTKEIFETVSTYEDIDIGRYRCTQCGEVFYYTGLWKKHWEEKSKKEE